MSLKIAQPASDAPPAAPINKATPATDPCGTSKAPTARAAKKTAQHSEATTRVTVDRCDLT
jgi:hypothetical protein